MKSRPKSVRILCDNCGNFIEIPTEKLAQPSNFIIYQGTACPKCGNVIIFDNLALRMVVPPRPIKKHTKKSSKKKGWKIVNKGKTNIDAPKSRRTPTPRKAS